MHGIIHHIPSLNLKIAILDSTVWNLQAGGINVMFFDDKLKQGPGPGRKMLYRVSCTSVGPTLLATMVGPFHVYEIAIVSRN